MLAVNSRIRIPDSELELSYVRSSGPGGQNVNKVSSKAVLRWNALASAALPDDVRQRFQAKFKSRLTTEGELIITSQRYRDQPRNAADAREKLRAMLASVATAPKRRKPTRPTKGSVERRIKSKQTVARKKQLRRGVSDE
ncbi:MAG: alternative ribosome rescue aminoacyl-tRNA hydrolase ArfB [Pirellulales bacterium]